MTSVTETSAGSPRRMRTACARRAPARRVA